jgi:DNA polymerase-3 subunit epsilon
MLDVDNKLLAIDLETTGLDVRRDRIVSASLVLTKLQSDKFESKNYLINPGVSIPYITTKIHGITNAEVIKNGMQPKIALQDIRNTISDAINSEIPLVIFNAPFDLPFLENELQRNGIETLHEIHGKIDLLIDPLALDRYMFPNRSGSRKLKSLIKEYNVPNYANLYAKLHNAEADCVATLKLFDRMFTVLSNTAGEVDVRQLYKMQVSVYEKYKKKYKNR